MADCLVVMLVEWKADSMAVYWVASTVDSTVDGMVDWTADGTAGTMVDC